jgi:hypothetical protein
MDAKTNALAVLNGGKASAELIAVLWEFRQTMVMDFDTPVSSIINRYANRLGLTVKQFNRLCEKVTGA